MSEHGRGDTGPAAGRRGRARDRREITGCWWLGLVAGIAWIVVALVILQFDQASVTTVGVARRAHVPVRRPSSSSCSPLADGALRWMSVIFGVLFAGRRRSSASSTPRTRSPGSPTSSASCS